MVSGSAENITNETINETIETNETCKNLFTELNIPFLPMLGQYWCSASDFLDAQFPIWGISMADALLAVVAMVVVLFILSNFGMITQGLFFKLAVVIIIFIIFLVFLNQM